MKISFQLYSARMVPDLHALLGELAEIGYREVEPFDGALQQIDALESSLARHGLSMPTLHTSMARLEARDPEIAGIVRRFGVTQIVCPFIAPQDRPADAAGYVEIGRAVMRARDVYGPMGCSIGWHNHDFEFHRLPDGSIPLDRIFEGGGPDMKWQADIAWIARAGADPFEYIEKYRDRLNCVHVKDIAPCGKNLDEDGWASLGEGIVDWPRLLDALRASGQVDHFIIEHDKPRNPLTFARKSFAALTQMLAKEQGCK